MKVEVLALRARMPRGGLELRNVSLVVEGGVTAILGTEGDGTGVLLAAMAGVARVRSGSVRVGGRPAGDGALTCGVAYIPRRPVVPEALRVEEALAFAGALRGGESAAPRARLELLGLEALAPRRIGTLAESELRAVLLAEALTSPGVAVLLVEEPLAAVDPRAMGALVPLLRARGGAGVTVILTTASPRDAAAVADQIWPLHGGVLASPRGSREEAAEGALGAVGQARLRVVVRDPRAFVRTLVEDPLLLDVELRGGAVVVGGPNVETLALAVARASAATKLDVEELGVAGDVPERYAMSPGRPVGWQG